jgi:hypothetical protein
MQLPAGSLCVLINLEDVWGEIGCQEDDQHVFLKGTSGANPIADAHTSTGGCDEVVLELLLALGWKSELEALRNDLPLATQSLLTSALGAAE